jgi:hypothetical protein
VLLTFILGLGRHIPLYPLMYNYLPMYGSFRGTVKFTYLTTLFISLLAGMGLDELLRNRRVTWVLLYPMLLGALGLGTLGLIIGDGAQQGGGGLWSSMVNFVVGKAIRGSEYYFRIDRADPAFLKASALQAAGAAYVACATIVGVAVLFWVSRYHRLLPYLLVVAATCELFVYARSTRATVDPAKSTAIPPAWREPVANLNKDQRVLFPMANAGMSIGYENLIGFDPGVLKRYAELIAVAQHQTPADATQYLLMGGVLPPVKIFRMLRVGQAFLYGNDGAAMPPVKIPDPLPIALLVWDWVELQTRDTVLSYVMLDSFNPATTVVLESKPGIQTVALASPPGSVKVLNRTTDTLELEATLDRPAILVITNNYSTGWHVKPIARAQTEYHVMPANYTQIGIPLEKGTHHFVLEYSPFAFRAGMWVSLLSVLALAGGSFLLMRYKL